MGKEVVGSADRCDRFVATRQGCVGLRVHTRSGRARRALTQSWNSIRATGDPVEYTVSGALDTGSQVQGITLHAQTPESFSLEMRVLPYLADIPVFVMLYFANFFWLSFANGDG